MLQLNTAHQVLALFLKQPTKKQYLKQIARDLQISHTAITPALQSLEKTNIIKKTYEIQGSRKYPKYSCNMSEAYYTHKKIHNYEQILLSGLITYLKNTTAPKTIILFGSYAKGEDTEASDIDIYIQAPSCELKLHSFEKILSRKIQIHFNPHFRKYSEELRSNLINGIILSGYLEP